MLKLCKFMGSDPINFCLDSVKKKLMGSDPINFFLRWRSGTQDGYADMKKAPMAFISHGRYSSFFFTCHATRTGDQSMPNSCAQYVLPFFTAVLTATVVKSGFKMFALCSGDAIHAFTTASAVL